MSYINFKNVSYNYPLKKEKAINNITLNIYKGEILFVLGKSGSGKSTLARCLTGAIPDFYGGNISGDILINNKSIKDFTHKERAKEITMVFQDPERQLVMDKVHREIAFSLENIGICDKDIKRRVWEAMTFFNISHLWDREVVSLSGGEKQKVVIASAVALKPSCIVLDEPISQLDPQSAEEVIYFIKKINEELGITIIIIEQRIDKWFDISDRILMIDSGKIKFTGEKEEFYKENFYDFLPSYLKINKLLGENSYKNIKDTRNIINKLSYKYTKKYIYESDSQNKSKFSFKNIFKKRSGEKHLIKLSNLSVKKEDKTILSNINLNFQQATFYTIMGQNGAGKSTLLKTLMGLIDFKGDIYLKQNSIKNLKRKEIAKLIGYVSQNPNDYISKDTVEEEIKFTLNNFEINEDKAIDHILNDLNIINLKNINPRDVSGGEKQRIAIASIMVMKPEIIILDEPTRGLDNVAKEKLGKFLKSLVKTGSTVIMVTHDMDFSSEYADEIILMFNGKIVAKNSKEKILKDGIYYTSIVHNLCKDKYPEIFSIKDFKKLVE